MTRAVDHIRRGEQHYKAKFDWPTVREIRTLHANMKKTNRNKGYTKLARMYHVDLATIKSICTYHTWKER